MKIKKILLIAPPAYTLSTARDIWPLPPMGLSGLERYNEHFATAVAIDAYISLYESL